MKNETIETISEETNDEFSSDEFSDDEFDNATYENLNGKFNEIMSQILAYFICSWSNFNPY